ncbi:MAG: bifunctional hydroxymethylpyrimidine kinase/phosphomethylpyrimidine kinase [Motiliproteus sp.]
MKEKKAVNSDCVLVVAGSDCSAGAGIQADLKTCSALGVYAATAITAITAQNSLGVTQIELVSPELVAQQMRSVLADLPVAVIKIGMLGSGAIVTAVCSVLEEYPQVPVVLDPVILSSSGRQLLDGVGKNVLIEKLLPLVSLLTPNLAEAADLLGLSLKQVSQQPEEAARALSDFGVAAVLIKGGHAEGDVCEDLLWSEGELSQFVAPRLAVVNDHGTGCTLASAIAAGLAKGLLLSQAMAQAKEYLTRTLSSADRFNRGQGRGALNHFDW